MWRVVTGMTNSYAARARTALSPEWDHGFDEAFTELISNDPDLVRQEFDALIGADYAEPPEPPSPAGQPELRRSSADRGQSTPDQATERIPAGPDAGRHPPP
jgi:hypothetical protein